MNQHTEFVFVFAHIAAFSAEVEDQTVNVCQNDKRGREHRPIVELEHQTVTVETPHLLRLILYHLEGVAGTWDKACDNNS